MSRHVIRRPRDPSRVVVPWAVGMEFGGAESFGLGSNMCLVDVVEHMLDLTGPARVTIAAWTSSTSSVEHAVRLMADARLVDLRFFVDHTFERRQPVFVQQLVERFGPDVLVVDKTHAKFAIVDGVSGRRAAVIGSLNLNRHDQVETYETTCDPATIAFLVGLVGSGKVLAVELRADLFGEGLLDRDVRRIGLSTRRGPLGAA